MAEHAINCFTTPCLDCFVPRLRAHERQAVRIAADLPRGRQTIVRGEFDEVSGKYTNSWEEDVFISDRERAESGLRQSNRKAANPARIARVTRALELLEDCRNRNYSDIKWK